MQLLLDNFLYPVGTEVQRVQRFSKLNTGDIILGNTTAKNAIRTKRLPINSLNALKCDVFALSQKSNMSTTLSITL
eukprot:6473411-Amphidinium_carterae.1